MRSRSQRVGVGLSRQASAVSLALRINSVIQACQLASSVGAVLDAPRKRVGKALAGRDRNTVAEVHAAQHRGVVDALRGRVGADDGRQRGGSARGRGHGRDGGCGHGGVAVAVRSLAAGHVAVGVGAAAVERRRLGCVFANMGWVRD
jgi:hypothetical protein